MSINRFDIVLVRKTLLVTNLCAILALNTIAAAPARPNTSTSNGGRAAVSQSSAALSELAALQKPSQNETVSQALTRYRAALAVAARINNIYQSIFELKQYPKMGAAEATSLEQQFTSPMPSQLKELATRLGPFQIGESEQGLDVLGDYRDRRKSRGLVSYVDTVWGGRPEFKENYKSEQLRFLNENYFVFGMRGINDNEHEYFYFDRSGKFGTLYFDQDGPFREAFDPFLKASPAKETSLDHLVSTQISEFIEQLIENLKS